MPIRSLLSETSFNSDQTEMIAKAFDESWAELQGGQAEPAMSSLVRTALAKRIIETAQRGGMTAEKLRDEPLRTSKTTRFGPLYRNELKRWPAWHLCPLAAGMRCLGASGRNRPARP